MSTLGKYNISSYIDDLIPEHIRSLYPDLVEFLKIYALYLERQNKSGFYLNSIDIQRDIDHVETTLLTELQNEIGVPVPRDFATDPRMFYKRLVEFYRSRGTPESITSFFRIIYDDDVETYFPFVDLLNPSDGDWIDQAADIKINQSAYTAWNTFTISPTTAGSFIAGLKYKIVSLGNDLFTAGTFLPTAEYTIVSLGTDTLATVTAGSFVTGTEYTILVPGATDFTLIGLPNNNINAGSFIVGTKYKITTFTGTSQAQWNTAAGTSGVTYAIDSIFTAAAAGAGTGIATTIGDVGEIFTATGGGTGDGTATYVITIQEHWNTTVGTTGVTYVVDTVFTATGVGTGTGTAQRSPTDFTLIGAIDNNIGTVFTATGDGGDIFLKNDGTTLGYGTATSNLVSGNNDDENAALFDNDVVFVNDVYQTPGTDYNEEIYLASTTIKYKLTFTNPLTNNDVVKTYPKGLFTTSNGFLSDLGNYQTKYLQDSHYWQQFSYVLKTGSNVAKWKNAFTRLVHPAGFIFFGEILIFIWDKDEHKLLNNVQYGWLPPGGAHTLNLPAKQIGPITFHEIGSYIEKTYAMQSPTGSGGSIGGKWDIGMWDHWENMKFRYLGPISNFVSYTIQDGINNNIGIQHNQEVMKLTCDTVNLYEGEPYTSTYTRPYIVNGNDQNSDITYYVQDCTATYG